MRIYPRGKKGILWVDGTILGERINRSSGTTSRQAAQEWADTIASDTWRRRKLGERPATTWGAAVLDWMRRHADSRRSIETIKDRLRWLTEKLGAETTLPIDPDRLDEILLAWKPRHGEGANTTRNRFVAEVSKIHHYAKKRKWLDAVPDLIRYEPGEDDDIRWATQEQADRIIAELPPHLADMARFALATGLRESNVRLFRWDWLGNGCAWVPRRSVKNKRPLFVPLNADALEVLARRKGEHPVYAFVYKGPSDDDAHTVWNCSTAAWYKACQRAGMGTYTKTLVSAPGEPKRYSMAWEGFRWHDWRHTWATWHLMAGTPREVLQQLGGWSDSKMVERYAHVANDWAARFAGGSLRVAKPPAISESNFPILAESSLSADVETEKLGWLMGLEPTTTGITKQPPGNSVAKVLNLNDALARKRRKTA